MRTLAVCLLAIGSGPALAETLEAFFERNEKPAYECMKRDVGRLMEVSDYSLAAVRQIGEIVAYLCTQELREKIRQNYPDNSFHAGESAGWIQIGAQEIAQSMALRIRKQKVQTMPRGPRGEKRPADAIGNASMRCSVRAR